MVKYLFSYEVKLSKERWFERDTGVVDRRCTGPSLNGANFTEAGWQTKANPETITHGRGGMPSFGKRPPLEKITSPAAYVKTFKRASRRSK